MPPRFNFTRVLDLKLIALVKQNPMLYNPSHEKYMDVDTREVTWHKIGDALGRPAQDCKARWVNIRDMMKRRIRDRKRNPDLEHVRHYKYEEELQFLQPCFKDAPVKEDYGSYEDNTLEESTQVYYEEEYVPDVKYNVKQKRSRQEDPARHSLQMLEPQELNPADPLDVFMLTIGATLRKFNPYYLNQAKSKIFQVVQDYELKQIVNEEPNGSSSIVKHNSL